MRPHPHLQLQPREARANPPHKLPPTFAVVPFLNDLREHVVSIPTRAPRPPRAVRAGEPDYLGRWHVFLGLPDDC